MGLADANKKRIINANRAEKKNTFKEESSHFFQQGRNFRQNLT